MKEERRKKKALQAAGEAASPAALPSASQSATVPAPTKAQVQETPVAFLFPGQGSQAVGMLKVSSPPLNPCRMIKPDAGPKI